MSDLKTRLRQWSEVTEGEDGLSRAKVEREALDRIESLERQLKEAQDALRTIHDTFKRDMDQDYKTKDKQFAADIARPFISEPDKPEYNCMAKWPFPTSEDGKGGHDPLCIGGDKGPCNCGLATRPTSAEKDGGEE